MYDSFSKTIWDPAKVWILDWNCVSRIVDAAWLACSNIPHVHVSFVVSVVAMPYAAAAEATMHLNQLSEPADTGTMLSSVCCKSPVPVAIP